MITKDETSIETYKSLISISTEGIKFCGLINGGAVIAILTFIGSMATQGNLKLLNINKICNLTVIFYT